MFHKIQTYEHTQTHTYAYIHTYRLTIISWYSKERNSYIFKEYAIYIFCQNEYFHILSNKSNFLCTMEYAQNGISKYFGDLNLNSRVQTKYTYNIKLNELLARQKFL